MGLKAMKDVKPDELADAINQCSAVVVKTVVNGRFVDRLEAQFVGWKVSQECTGKDGTVVGMLLK